MFYENIYTEYNINGIWRFISEKQVYCSSNYNIKCLLGSSNDNDGLPSLSLRGLPNDLSKELKELILKDNITKANYINMMDYITFKNKFRDFEIRTNSIKERKYLEDLKQRQVNLLESLMDKIQEDVGKVEKKYKCQILWWNCRIVYWLSK